MNRVVAALTGLGILAAGLTGCGANTSPSTLTVLAASSLTEVYTTLAATYEKEHPGVSVRLVFDSSATLAQMAQQHAPGDVLATADQRTMDAAVADKGVNGTATQFATNVMVLAVPAANPAHIESIADLGRANFVICVPTAPCGAAAATLLKSNHTSADPVSEEVDVKSVLAKVAAGEADAGLVYATDAKAAGKAVTSMAIPGADQNPNTYWVAVTAAAKDQRLAEDWITLLTSSAGRQALLNAGFGTP